MEKKTTKIKSIVILTSGMKKDARQPEGWKPDLAEHLRLAAAARLYHSIPGEKPYFLISGGKTYGNYNPSLAKVLEEVAVRKYEIPKNKIILEEKSKDTTENAEFSKEVLNKKGVGLEGMIVLTNDYQLKRAKTAFKLYKMHPQMVSAEEVLEGKSPRYKKFIEAYVKTEEVKDLTNKNKRWDWILKVFGSKIFRLYTHATRKGIAHLLIF